jgi:hypothetical protein
MSNNGNGVDQRRDAEQYIDPQGYWIDPERNLRRMGTEYGEQKVIMKATEDCSNAEWNKLYEAIVSCLVMNQRT